MRIIAGRLKGRLFDSPPGHRTHPMADKVRGALFNTLGDIEGLTVLDAFAGSGAVAFEAISRGAAAVVALDVNTAAARTIRENARLLQVDTRLQTIRASAAGWLQTQPDQTFDIVICDPPYDDPQLVLVARLAARAKLGGTIVVSLPPTAELAWSLDYSLLAAKNYGDATLYFYRRAA